MRMICSVPTSRKVVLECVRTLFIECIQSCCLLSSFCSHRCRISVVCKAKSMLLSHSLFHFKLDKNTSNKCKTFLNDPSSSVCLALPRFLEIAQKSEYLLKVFFFFWMGNMTHGGYFGNVRKFRASCFSSLVVDPTVPHFQRGESLFVEKITHIFLAYFHMHKYFCSNLFYRALLCIVLSCWFLGDDWRLRG